MWGDSEQAPGAKYSFMKEALLVYSLFTAARLMPFLIVSTAI
jgi:hypothetical protein